MTHMTESPVQQTATKTDVMPEKTNKELLADFEAPIRRQEFVRKEFYDIIDEVLGDHCPAFGAWKDAKDSTTWAEIPSEAILLRSQHLTSANIALNGLRYAAHEEIRRNMETACKNSERKLLKIRSEELASRRRRKMISGR